MSKGFTLFEVLVIIFIISFLSVAILFNYRTSQDQASLTRSAAAFESEIRKAQNLAVAGVDFSGAIPCGYGLLYIDNRTYRIYVGRLNGAVNCQSANHNYQSGTDLIYQELKIIESGVIFGTSFSDVFFEPPDPATYINNNKSVGISQTIQLCLEKDLTKCRNLTIDTAGRIATQ
ncbi:MAG: hypothetical protein G01um10142_179 [Parcubacteria group bacterium Gr01-1014_2]|nr:MAG: hypothetical protein G01um10142_179 [Parcubacteria group bacterium Gr01-1014_2]